MLNLAAALLPAFLLLMYFVKKDAYPEPTHLLVKTFVLGCLTVIPVVIIALPMMETINSIPDPLTRATQTAFVLAAIPEELMKWMVVWFFCAQKSDFDEPMDGFVYGATASLGFAALENILYVGEGGLGVALARAFTAVPAHAFFGAIMGYYISKAVFTEPERRGRNLLLSFLIPMVLHGVYDIGPMYLQALGEEGINSAGAGILLPILLFLVTLIGMWIWVKRLVARAVAHQAEAEAEA